jgi:hypothetical protein
MIRAVAAVALLLAGCEREQDPDPAVDGTALDWRVTDVCAHVQTDDLAELARSALRKQRLSEADRIGCAFVDKNGMDRFTAVLAYRGYDPRDIALLSPEQAGSDQRLREAAWLRQIDLAGHPALVVSEGSETCQAILPLSGEQEGWEVRLSLDPQDPAPSGQSACQAHLGVLQGAVRELPGALSPAEEAPASATPSVQAAPELLANSCDEFRSVKGQTNTMALPLLDSAGKPPSPETAKAMQISTQAAAEGFQRSSGVAQRLAGRPLPAQLRTELRLYARNAQLLLQKLQGQLQPGQIYLALAMAVHVNEAKALSFCPSR